MLSSAANFANYLINLLALPGQLASLALYQLEVLVAHLVGIPALMLACFAAGMVYKAKLMREADKLKASALKVIGK